MDVFVPCACQQIQERSNTWDLCRKHIYSSDFFACSWIGDHILIPCTQGAAITALWSSAGVLWILALKSWPCLSSLLPLPSAVLTIREERRMAGLERGGGERAAVPGLQFFPGELLSPSATQRAQPLPTVSWASFPSQTSLPVKCKARDWGILFTSVYCDVSLQGWGSETYCRGESFARESKQSPKEGFAGLAFWSSTKLCSNIGWFLYVWKG